MLIQVESNPTADVMAYRDNVLLKQTVNRYTNSWAHHQSFFYYFIEVIPLFWLPLSLFIPWLIKPVEKAFKDKEPGIIYPLVMVFFVVFFFSLSKGKRAEYMFPIIPMFVLVIAPYFELLMNKKGLQRLFVILVLLFSVLFTLIGLAGIFEVEKVSRLTAKYFVNPLYWMASLGVFGLLVLAFFRKKGVKLYSIFVVGLWLTYGFWAAPMVDKAMSTKPMMDAIAHVIPKQAELGLVGMREKLLLHTQWKTTYFGHHNPKVEQQQAAINWIAQTSNRYLLVNHQYLNDCFTKESGLNYDSLHNEKWILYSNKTLNSVNCVVDNKSYLEYSTD